MALIEFVSLLREAAGQVAGAGPQIVAVDGRSSSGKTTLAGRVNDAVPDSYVIHTDDIAWAHSRFGWTDLLVSGVLEPLRQGRAMAFRPPAWTAHNRAGDIEVPTDLSLVIVEGVGAGRLDLSHVMDATVWVQAGLVDIESRNAARVRTGEVEESGVREWMAEEFPFLEREQPWRNAALITAGGTVRGCDPHADVAISRPLRASSMKP